MMRKINISDNNIKKMVAIYIWISLIVCEATRIMPVKQFIGEEVNSLLFKVIAVVGVVLLLFDVIYSKFWRSGLYINILYLFITTMMISSIINYEYGIVDNVKTIVWMSILIGLVYTFANRCSKQEISNFLTAFWKFFVVTWLVPIMYSLFQFTTLEGYLTSNGERLVRQGFYDNRLFGVFNDPNYAAVMSVCAIFACVLLLYKNSSKAWRIFIVLDIIFQGLYVVLSGSRTAMICVIFTSSFLLCIKYYKNNESKHILKQILIYIMIVVVISCSTFAGYKIIQKISMALPIAYVVVVLGESDYESYIDDKMLKREDVEKSNISNNRLTIWKAYISGMKDDYFFGGSPRNVLLKWQDKNPTGYLAKTEYETHNAYINVLVGTGIIGSVLIMIYVILFAIKLFKYIRAKKCIGSEMKFTMSYLIVTILYMLFFSDVFFIFSFTSILFWLHCGVAINLFDNHYSRSVNVINSLDYNL